MKIETVEIGKTDVVMVHHSVGNLPPKDVKKHCDEVTKALVNIFGKGRVALFPTRSEEEWDFTVVKRV